MASILSNYTTSSTTRSSLRTLPLANVVQLQSSSPGSPSPGGSHLKHLELQRINNQSFHLEVTPSHRRDLLHPHPIHPEISEPLSILIFFILSIRQKAKDRTESLHRRWRPRRHPQLPTAEAASDRGFKVLPQGGGRRRGVAASSEVLTCGQVKFISKPTRWCPIVS